MSNDGRDLEQPWVQEASVSEDTVRNDFFPAQAIKDEATETEQQQEFIRTSVASTQLELAMSEEINRKTSQIERLTREVAKLQNFISKRKQTYKRKRKEEGAPTRALSAYNIFVQDRFSQLARENEEALKSSDTNAQMKRVPPASLVASTGNEWRELPAEKKSIYEEKARNDRRRYEQQMAAYQPPEKQRNKKRNKTGYNMFFSSHVHNLKSVDTGVPNERGSVARLVGNAWKNLTVEEKQFYEREAEKVNAIDAVNLETEENSKLPGNAATETARFSPVAARGTGGARMEPASHRGLGPPSQMMHPLVHGHGHTSRGHLHGHYNQSYQPHNQGYQYANHQLHSSHQAMDSVLHPSHVPGQAHHHSQGHLGRGQSQRSSHPQQQQPLSPRSQHMSSHHHTGV